MTPAEATPRVRLWATHVHKFASELQIVIESKLGLGGVGDISCVRDRGLHDATRRADRIDAELEIVQIIQRAVT